MNIKPLLVPIYLSLSVFSHALALEPGDKVTIDALKEAEFIKGEAPKKWEKGKVYIIECWATWCMPCIAAIPHLDELYDKYSEQGLVVIGMDVWEDQKDLGVKFVQKKGDGMSYPVAYAARGSKFDTDWIKGAGVEGIPHAFVIKDGTLVMEANPQELTEAKIKELLDNKLDIQEVSKHASETKKKQKAIQEVKDKFAKALKSGDNVAIDKALDSAQSLDSNLYQLLKAQVLLEGKKWAELATLLPKITVGYDALVTDLCIRIDLCENVKPEVLKLVIQLAERTLENRPETHVAKASIYSKLEDKKNALLSAKKAQKEFKKIFISMNLPNFFAKPLALFVRRIEQDNPMTTKELMKEFSKVKGIHMKPQE